MKAKANVLQVMDTIIHEISWHSDIRAAELSEARAAVAELIEATRELIDFAEPQLRDHGFGYMGKFEKARKALANVGGAK